MADNDQIPNMRNIIRMFEARTTIEDVCTEESATDTDISERANGEMGKRLRKTTRFFYISICTVFVFRNN